ncbi:chemotaxis-specific protein-glutamate methyltransferase CheB [Aquabacterium sp.]|uniref:chemotaxis-specific protein-glutamate methyltransferase CheB n=1 Tax=Aquabacterium sp. TaxID=1872578 RepID=UPI002BCEC16D|nr:chemotaxis-specific protein-glutamate methyltransferase CheB [Aquabacterium sp.]HSW06791.1 chemotaxis-specific protein-glutamate methyltransferase CheB [Aquabacterium sp.]
MSRSPSSPPIRILVVDDSAASRELLMGVLNGHPGLDVVGTAVDGETALRQAQRLQPDVITMDIHMPGIDGFATTRLIMERCPTRVVMVTATSFPSEVAASFHALECGALTVIGKPLGPGHPQFAAAADELVRTVMLMAEVHVVKRWPSAGRTLPPAAVTTATSTAASTAALPAAQADRGARLIAIGASTGGPIVLQDILSRLRPGLGAPVLIVQHISTGFTAGFVQWLAQTTGFNVRQAAHGDIVQPAVAYVAPDGKHMAIQAGGRIVLSEEPPEYGLRPSVASLFRSAAAAYGPRAIGVLLTGMGSDGALELKAMREAGALTLVQDAESAVIYGMPGQAVKLGAASHVLAPEAIAATLNRWVP